MEINRVNMFSQNQRTLLIIIHCSPQSINEISKLFFFCQVKLSVQKVCKRQLCVSLKKNTFCLLFFPIAFMLSGVCMHDCGLHGFTSCVCFPTLLPNLEQSSPYCAVQQIKVSNFLLSHFKVFIFIILLNFILGLCLAPQLILCLKLAVCKISRT